jgi:hypothetical protein
MKNLLSVALLGLGLMLAGAALAQSQTAMCTVKTRLDLSKNCQGKTVQLSGALGIGTAHPVMTTPDLPHQNYLDTSLGQIVLLTQKPINCPSKKLLVTGKLGWKAMGGAAGTRDSYANAFVMVSSLKCL